MPRSGAISRDTSVQTYRTKRDFSATGEPVPGSRRKAGRQEPMFVVQKYVARRAGVHWNFRLEHGGIL